MEDSVEAGFEAAEDSRRGGFEIRGEHEDRMDTDRTLATLGPQGFRAQRRNRHLCRRRPQQPFGRVRPASSQSDADQCTSYIEYPSRSDADEAMRSLGQQDLKGATVTISEMVRPFSLRAWTDAPPEQGRRAPPRRRLRRWTSRRLPPSRRLPSPRRVPSRRPTRR